MVELAFGIVCAAALPGLGLASQRLAGSSPARPRQIVAMLHGTLGAAGLAILLAALDRAPMPTSAMGTDGFGAASAGLLALALVLGLAVAWRGWSGRRAPGVMIGAHAGLAIAGLVVLSALVVLG